jgi:hypothetical protein
MQQYVIFNVLKEYCISKEEEDGTRRFDAIVLQIFNYPCVMGFHTIIDFPI